MTGKRLSCWLNIKCNACYKNIEIRKSSLKEKNYCSKECRKQYKWVQLECLICKKTFSRIPSLVSKNNYCSKSCSYKGVALSRVGKRSINTKHGTFRMYNAYKCRCDECRTNWNNYVNNRKKVKKDE